MGRSVKVLHCADLHLGSAFSAAEKRVAGARRADLLRTFREIVRLCPREGVDLLLIAGDLFDSVHPPKELLQEVRAAFASIPSTTVAIAPGNHDPATVDSPWLPAEFWPDNVLLFRQPRLTPVVLQQLGVCLWGAGFPGAYVTESLLGEAPGAQSGLLNICVLHGELLPAGQTSGYNPITPAQLLRCGMDYVALGHLHKRTPQAQAGSTHYAYSGCPEGRGFGEPGELGVYLGEIAPGAVALEFVPLCRRQYVTLPVATGSAADTPSAAALVLAAMEQAMGSAYGDHLYRVILEGEVNRDAYLNPAAIREALEDKGVFYAGVTDQTRLPLGDEQDAAAEFSLRGMFLRKAGEALAGGMEERRLQGALKLGLRAFAGKVEYHAD